MVVKYMLQVAWTSPPLWPSGFSWHGLSTGLTSLLTTFLGRHSTFLTAPTSWNLHSSPGFTLTASYIALSWASDRDCDLVIPHCLVFQAFLWYRIEASMTCNSGCLQNQHYMDDDKVWCSFWVSGCLNPGIHFSRWPWTRKAPWALFLKSFLKWSLLLLQCKLLGFLCSYSFLEHIPTLYILLF